MSVIRYLVNNTTIVRIIESPLHLNGVANGWSGKTIVGTITVIEHDGGIGASAGDIIIESLLT